jgi:hypothetical protein
MSPKLADEARVIRLASTMTRTPVLTLQKLETGNGPAILREAARRELLRRSLAVGVKG